MNDRDLDFKRIHDTYAPKIRRYLERLAGKDDAEDLTQETFARISRSFHTFKGEAGLWTWIYKIATNTAIDRLRENRIAKSGIALDEAEQMEDQDIWTGERRTLEDQIIRNEMNDCIRNVVFRLPEAYRAVIILSEFEGFTNEDIARILGLSLDAAKIRLHRARTRLKEELSKQCILYRDDRNEFACEQKHDALLRKDQIVSLIKK